MNRNEHFKTVSLKNQTHERIKHEAEATGLKIWALVDLMTEDYFNNDR